MPTDVAVAAVLLLPLITAVVIAAVIDWRSRRIPNSLTVPLLAAGLVRAIVFDGFYVPTIGDALLGIAGGFALTLPLFVLRAAGAGDVKLLTAAGAWLGPGGVLALFLVTTLIATLMLLMQCAATGKLLALFRNTPVAAMSLFNARRLGIEMAAGTGKQFQSVDKPLPWAVPLLAGLIICLWPAVPAWLVG